LLGIFYLIIAGSLPAGRQGFLFWAHYPLFWGVFFCPKMQCLLYFQPIYKMPSKIQ
jgi:hypothetical protein